MTPTEQRTQIIDAATRAAKEYAPYVGLGEGSFPPVVLEREEALIADLLTRVGEESQWEVRCIFEWWDSLSPVRQIVYAEYLRGSEGASLNDDSDEVMEFVVEKHRARILEARETAKLANEHLEGFIRGLISEVVAGVGTGEGGSAIAQITSATEFLDACNQYVNKIPELEPESEELGERFESAWNALSATDRREVGAVLVQLVTQRTRLLQGAVQIVADRVA